MKYRLKQWFGHLLEENKVCQDCGQSKPDVTETFCPYASDINNDSTVEITVCKDCYSERSNDI